MSFFRSPMPPAPATPPNPVDVDNRVNDERRRRLATGGRNATSVTAGGSALAQMATGAASGARATLTGLNG